jgi:hypothetical protein
MMVTRRQRLRLAKRLIQGIDQSSPVEACGHLRRVDMLHAIIQPHPRRSDND